MTDKIPINTLLLSDSEEDIKKAADILKSGGLVAFPTETVYGLGGNALSPKASEKIYAAKGRPSDNPLIVHICDTSSVYELATEVPEKARALMEAFWPGPLTIILPKAPSVPHETTGGLDTVAIRMPSHPAALALIKESGVYIAAPSANTSGRPSPTTATHVWDDLKGRIDIIIDGGSVGIGIESTIVDLTSETPSILRPGYITKKMLENIIGEVTIDPAIIHPDPNLRPKAPGMKYTHYSPKGSLTIVEYRGTTAEDNNENISPIDNSADNISLIENSSENRLSESESLKAVAETIGKLVEEKEAAGFKVAVLTPEEHAGLYKAGNIIRVGSLESGVTVAARLYAALRECDDIGADYIYSESFRTLELGGAIMNRLLKAAGQDIIYL